MGFGFILFFRQTHINGRNMHLVQGSMSVAELCQARICHVCGFCASSRVDAKIYQDLRCSSCTALLGR